jgi:hypothetical protein
MNHEESDVPLPPDDERQQKNKTKQKPIQENPISRSSGANVPPPGPGREPSAEEEAGVSSTDTEATSPHGVGESETRRGEDIRKDEGKEAGRKEAGRTGKAQRPAGTSGSRDSTSIDTQEPIDPASPGQPAGN